MTYYTQQFFIEWTISKIDKNVGPKMIQTLWPDHVLLKLSIGWPKLVLSNCVLKFNSWQLFNLILLWDSLTEGWHYRDEFVLTNSCVCVLKKKKNPTFPVWTFDSHCIDCFSPVNPGPSVEWMTLMERTGKRDILRWEFKADF